MRTKKHLSQWSTVRKQKLVRNDPIGAFLIFNVYKDKELGNLFLSEYAGNKTQESPRYFISQMLGLNVTRPERKQALPLTRPNEIPEEWTPLRGNPNLAKKIIEAHFPPIFLGSRRDTSEISIHYDPDYRSNFWKENQQDNLTRLREDIDLK